MEDPFDLQRFVSAQDAHGTYDEALRELRRGRKQTHWMWFVFPQIAGLGAQRDSAALRALRVWPEAGGVRRPIRCSDDGSSRVPAPSPDPSPSTTPNGCCGPPSMPRSSGRR